MGLFETINTVSVILFAAGMVLLTIEMFMPGFGIFGGLGLAALVLCIAFQATTVVEALIMVLAFGAIVALFLLVLARSFRKGRIYRSSIVLKNTADKSDGYVSNDDYSHLLGRKGKSVTVLRPSGIAEFGGEKTDVVTEGEFLPKGADVEVTAVAGRRIVVREILVAAKQESINVAPGGDTLNM